VLRLIQATLNQVSQAPPDQRVLPTLRACGLAETDLPVLENGELVELWHTAEGGAELDQYTVSAIKPAGRAILTRAEVDSPRAVPVTLQAPPVPLSRRIAQVLATKLWDTAKIALGAVLGWLLKSWLE
jgi:hypothetical protein